MRDQRSLAEEIDARRVPLDAFLRFGPNDAYPAWDPGLDDQLRDLIRLAGEEARALAAIVRDVLHLWEIREHGTRPVYRVPVARQAHVWTDGEGLYVDEECLLVHGPTDAGRRAPVVVNPKRFRRGSLEWSVRDEAERLLAEQEQPTVRVRSPLPLPGPVTAKCLANAWQAAELIERGIDYPEVAASLVETWMLGRTVRVFDHGLTTTVGDLAIFTGRTRPRLLVAWDPSCRELYRRRHLGRPPGGPELRAWFSTQPFRKGTHERQLRDALRDPLEQWGVVLVEKPEGINPQPVAQAAIAARLEEMQPPAPRRTDGR